MPVFCVALVRASVPATPLRVFSSPATVVIRLYRASDKKRPLTFSCKDRDCLVRTSHSISSIALFLRTFAMNFFAFEWDGTRAQFAHVVERNVPLACRARATRQDPKRMGHAPHPYRESNTSHKASLPSFPLDSTLSECSAVSDHLPFWRDYSCF